VIARTPCEWNHITSAAKINIRSYELYVITGAQIRAARALIRWTAEDLASTAKVGIATVRRAEGEDGQPSTTAANLNAIRVALENAGVEFVPENGGGAGVRLKK
jgi:transcriptional regulator with XRE-family HTH domain